MKKETRYKIIIGILALLAGVIALDGMSTYESTYSVVDVRETDGKIEVEMEVPSNTWGGLRHYEFTPIDAISGSYRLHVYCNFFGGGDLWPTFVYEVDNKDGHIKEIQDSKGNVIYPIKEGYDEYE